jgi:hypothetical protein
VLRHRGAPSLLFLSSAAAWRGSGGWRHRQALLPARPWQAAGRLVWWWCDGGCLLEVRLLHGGGAKVAGGAFCGTMVVLWGVPGHLSSKVLRLLCSSTCSCRLGFSFSQLGMLRRKPWCRRLRASISPLGAPLGSCYNRCMRGLWVKTLFTCGRASAAPLASHPPWGRRLLRPSLTCSGRCVAFGG